MKVPKSRSIQWTVSGIIVKMKPKFHTQVEIVSMSKEGSIPTNVMVPLTSSVDASECATSDKEYDSMFWSGAKCMDKYWNDCLI